MRRCSMEITRRTHASFYPGYRLFTVILIIIAAFAPILSPPAEILPGVWQIMTSRSLLVTDYMAVGGAGAMLINGALAGLFAMLIMMLIGVKPNGATIMSLWITVGFGFFGKNVLNMLPLITGVWLYTRFQKEPLIDYSLAALMVATLSPVVSELAFGFGVLNPLAGGALAIAVGIVTGFVFPMLAAFTVRVHDGYCLYNTGFAGGILAMFLVAIFKAVGITIETAQLWAIGKDIELAAMVYILSVVLIAAGFIMGRGSDIKHGLRQINASSGRLVSDYLALYGGSAYINMGALGIISTSLMLVLGIDINGPTLGGIFTIVGFGCFGKHLRNVLPVMAGAILSSIMNISQISDPGNALAILFSTALAPIAGRFGPFWGIIAGFLHVSIVQHTGLLPNGLNLYNNGFAAGFDAMVLVPVILSLKRARKE